MPRGFVDDPEGNIADEVVNDGGFGDDIDRIEMLDSFKKYGCEKTTL